jgi:hypothetical protein
MKRLLVLLTLIIGGIHMFAQSAKTEYVPINLKWKSPGGSNMKANKPFDVAHYDYSNMVQTFTYTKVTYVDKENSSPTQQIDCVVTIKGDVIHVFFGEHHLQNSIVSRYLNEDNVRVMKTIDADNTVITYRIGDAGIYTEIDIPDYTIRLDK